jgi:hypothetical protein
MLHQRLKSVRAETEIDMPPPQAKEDYQDIPDTDRKPVIPTGRADNPIDIDDDENMVDARLDPTSLTGDRSKAIVIEDDENMADTKPDPASLTGGKSSAIVVEEDEKLAVVAEALTPARERGGDDAEGD